jgi:mono/diheme cytochrome c family protein
MKFPSQRTLTITAALFFLTAASADRAVQNPSIQAVNDGMSETDLLNQCAGTVQHYRLPATGYEPADFSGESLKGKNLYQSYRCASCHSIDGRGGKLGPPLDGIGGHRGKQFLVGHLLNPEEQMRDYPDLFGGRPNIMPHLGLSKTEAKEVAQYLLTLPEPANGFLITAHPKLDPHTRKQPTKPEAAAAPQSVAHGRQLFAENKCAMCHTVQGASTPFGPRLGNLSKRWDRASLINFLAEEDQNPAMKGKTMGLTESEVSAIADFLLSLKPSDGAN